MTLQTVSNGRPCEPEAEKLVEHFKAMSEDDIVEYMVLLPMVPTATGLNDPRLRTVVQSARRRFARESQVELIAVPGVGLRYPFGDEQVRHGVKGMKSGVRKIKRNTRVVGDVSDDRLPDIRLRSQRDHIIGNAKLLAEMGRTTMRKLDAHVGTPTPNPQ